MGARLDKIKKFFSRIFRGEEETKLLARGEQTGGQESEFVSGLRVDTKNPLDPEVYQGDRLFSNILMHVGVRRELAENPEVIQVLSEWLVRNYAKC